MQTTTLKIDGMTCMGCVNSVKKGFEEMSGVSKVEVSLEQAQATILYDADKINDNQFKEIIEDAGFDVVD